MNEQTQNIATALKWCQDENQKLRQELYDLKHDKEVLEARNEELEEELTEVKDEKEVLEEQMKQQDEWFEEINLLVGADPSEPAVNSVSDFVRKHQ